MSQICFQSGLNYIVCINNVTSRSQTESVKLKCVSYISVGGADVLYNKFNVSARGQIYDRWGRPSHYGYVGVAPVNPPRYPTSDYKCVVDTGGYYWRLSRCTDEHRVVCQSG